MAKKFLTNAEIMEKAEADIAGTLVQIRRGTSRTEAYKKAEVARAHQQMRAKRDQLIEERDTAKLAYQRELEGSLFGANTSSGDAASWAISRRDAGERAAQLDQPEEATSLLARAERSHDEPLARAIAERAYEMGWADVADAFLDSRPQLNEPFIELWSQANPTSQQVIMDSVAL